MNISFTKDKMDKAEKKEAKAAKKAKKAEEKRAKFLVSPKGQILAQIEEREKEIAALQAQYEQEEAVRGSDLRTWPIEVIAKYKAVAPYELYGIVLPEETGADTSTETTNEFDPTKGFQPTVQPEPELIHPFSFMTNGDVKVEKPKKDPAISDEEFAALEAAFSKFLVGQTYRYEAYNGIYKLFITRINSIEEEYIIDNGTVLGGSNFAILANKIYDTLFVFIDDPEVPEILKSKFYIVTEDCVLRNES